MPLAAPALGVLQAFSKEHLIEAVCLGKF